MLYRDRVKLLMKIYEKVEPKDPDIQKKFKELEKEAGAADLSKGAFEKGGVEKGISGDKLAQWFAKEQNNLFKFRNKLAQVETEILGKLTPDSQAAAQQLLRDNVSDAKAVSAINAFDPKFVTTPTLSARGS